MKTCEQEVKLDEIWSGFRTGDAEWWGRTVELFLRIDWIFLGYSDEGSFILSRNYPGKTNREPKRASEVEIAESSLRTLLRPSKPRGR